MKLISFLGGNDADILPQWIDHYLALGIREFHLILQGKWSNEQRAALERPEVIVTAETQETYGEFAKGLALTKLARRFVGEWIVIADADEFLELPYSTLDKTVRALSCLGTAELVATMLQRVAAEGRLSRLAPGELPERVFPYFDYSLCERMSVRFPVWKNKYALCRVSENFESLRGNHLPHLQRPAAHFPIRAVMHHYKWRDRLLTALKIPRGAGSNSSEMAAYEVWLEKNDYRLPTSGLELCRRELLFLRGYLHKPSSTDLRVFGALRKARLARSGDSPSVSRRLRSIPVAVPAAAESAQSQNHFDREHLLRAPGRIALVTVQFAGPHRGGGIGTAMGALAERLAAAGHEVHVLLCPYTGPTKLGADWIDYWSSRGVTLHYHPKEKLFRKSEEFSAHLGNLLAEHSWDLIHFHDAAGYAAVPLLMRASGSAFHRTSIILTAHGPTRWHRQGNRMSWDREEAAHSFLEQQAAALADLIICPSDYMRQWCLQNYSPVAPLEVMPNLLTGENRAFAPMMLPRRVTKVVFFGRLEVRKGITRFIDALRILAARECTDFEVVFLGRRGELLDEESVRAACADLPQKLSFFTNFSNEDAVHYLRNGPCIAIIASLRENSPYTVYECLENGVPFLASSVGGIPELIAPEDRQRVLMADGPQKLASAIEGALKDGSVPARLSFNPTHAEVDALAIHSAFLGRTPPEIHPSKATIILYGRNTISLNEKSLDELIAWAETHSGRIVVAKGILSESARKRCERSKCVSVLPYTESHVGRLLNLLAAAADRDVLIFCDGSLALDRESPVTLLATMTAAKAEAALSSFYVKGIGSKKLVLALGGPAELLPTENPFGCGFFAVTKHAFTQVGEFAEDSDAIDRVEWDFLNRVKAAGINVVGVPGGLVSTSHEPSLNGLPSDWIDPWIEHASPTVQGVIRKAMMPTPSRKTTGDRLKKILKRAQGVFTGKNDLR